MSIGAPPLLASQWAGEHASGSATGNVPSKVRAFFPNSDHVSCPRTLSPALELLMITQGPFFRFPFASCSSFLTLTHSLLSSCHHHRHLSRTTPTTSRTISSVSRLPQHPSTLSTPALACPPHIRPLISPILSASHPSTTHTRPPEMDPTDLDDRPTRGLHMGMDSAELRPPLVHHPHAHAPRQLSLRSWMAVKARRRRGKWRRVLRPLHSVRRSFRARFFSIATSCPTLGYSPISS